MMPFVSALLQSRTISSSSLEHLPQELEPTVSVPEPAADCEGVPRNPILKRIFELIKMMKGLVSHLDEGEVVAAAAGGVGEGQLAGVGGALRGTGGKGARGG